jgi:hypothetical protein
MNAFEIPATQYLTVAKVTPRKEIHGDEHVQAISLRLSWITANDDLDRLHPQLRDMLFWDPPEVVAQLQIEGLAPVKKHRRVPTVAMPIKLDRDHSGYTLTIDHGIDETSALELYSCAVNKFAVDANEGGSVTISWNVSSNAKITPELVGALCALEGESVPARMVAPPPGSEGETIDGTTGHPGLADAQAAEAERQAGDLFAEQHGAGPDDSDRHAGDFGDAGPGAGDSDDASGAGTEDAAEFEAGARAALEAAGVSERRSKRTRG